MSRHSLVRTIRADVRANQGRARILLAIILLRVASEARVSLGKRNPLALLLLLIYRFYALVVVSIDIPVGVSIGSGLAVHHGFGIVVSEGSVIGSNVSLHQAVTVGVAYSGGPSPVLMDECFIGPGAALLGGIRLGRGCKISANALVVHDVPAGARVSTVKAVVKE